jgi:hypothetical protein
VQPLGLIAAVVLATSAVACSVGVRWLGLHGAALGRAGLKTLEIVGMGAIFFGANLAAGMIFVAAARVLTGWFVSHYILSDVSLLALSLLQGMVFVWWQSAAGSRGRAIETCGAATGRD